MPISGYISGGGGRATHEHILFQKYFEDFGGVSFGLTINVLKQFLSFLPFFAQTFSIIVFG